MTTITKNMDAPTDNWTRVDANYSTLTMKRKSVYPMLYFVGADAPNSDEADGVHTWNGGAITVRDLGGSKVFVKAIDSANEVELMLGDAAVPLQSSTANLVDVVLTTDTAAYATGEVLADTQEVANAAPSVSAATALHSIMVLDKDDQGVGMDLVFLSANVPLGTENGALAITDANAAHILGIVSIAASDFVDLGGCRVATLKSVGLALRAAAASRSIYIAAISRGAGTYTAAGLTVRLGFI